MITMGGDNYKYSNLTKYSTIAEDNKLLKYNKELQERLSKIRKLEIENEILLSNKKIETVQDLISKYSNEYHELEYYQKIHSILIRGSMFVPIFHAFMKDAKQFEFEDIKLD